MQQLNTRSRGPAWMPGINLEDAVTMKRAEPGRPRAPRPTRPNLISTWRAIHGELEPTALEDLNEALGTGYTLSRVGEWERGKRVPHVTVMNYMLSQVMASVLKDRGLDAGDVAELVDSVTLPDSNAD